MSGVRGVVADIVQPPPELETAVEAVLGERLGNIIVESHEVGVEAIEFLKSQSEGRSSFIPVGLRAPAEGSVVYDASGGVSVDPAPAPALWPTGDGVRGPMLELIGFDRQYDRVAAYLLGDVLVVEDLRRALELWRETRTNKTIVTLDGEVIDPHGVVTGGSRESATAGVLSQKREIRELEAVVARIDADYQAALDRHVSAKQQLVDITAEREEIVAALRRDEMDRVAHEKDLDRVMRERKQQENRAAQLAGNQGQLQASAEQNGQRLTEAREHRQRQETAAQEAEARAAGLRGEVEALAEKVDALVTELTTLKIAASQAEERRRTARETMERLRRERGEQEERKKRLEISAAEDAARAETLSADAARLREEAALWQSEAEARAKEHADRQGVVEERNSILSRREADLRAARSSVNALASELGSLELRCQEARLRRE